MGLMLTAAPVSAAEEEGETPSTPALAAAATSLVLHPAPADASALVPRFVAPRRPLLLPSLYTASALLQGYDIYSTLTALKYGAVEANPMMESVVKNPAAFVAMKAGATASSILIAERLWKDNHRFGAVMVMVISNSAMAMVAAHNASVLHRVQSDGLSSNRVPATPILERGPVP